MNTQAGRRAPPDVSPGPSGAAAGPAGVVLGLVRGSHPGPVVAVTVIMTTLAVTAGRGTGTLWVGLAVLAGQLSVGWSNDYLDRHRDRRSERAAKRSAKPVAAGMLPARVAGTAALVALGATAALSFGSGWRAAAAHLTGVAAAWGYNLGLKATVASFAPYAAAFGLLPAFVTLGLAGHPWPHWWVSAAGASLGVAAHFANVLADIPDDVAAGIRGLPHRLGERPSRLITVGALLAATLLVLTAPGGDRWGGPAAGAVAGVVTLAALALATPWRERTGQGFFAGVVALAALDVSILIAGGTAIY